MSSPTASTCFTRQGEKWVGCIAPKKKMGYAANEVRIKPFRARRPDVDSRFEIAICSPGVISRPPLYIIVTTVVKLQTTISNPSNDLQKRLSPSNGPVWLWTLHGHGAAALPKRQISIIWLASMLMQVNSCLDCEVSIVVEVVGEAYFASR